MSAWKAVVVIVIVVILISAGWYLLIREPDDDENGVIEVDSTVIEITNVTFHLNVDEYPRVDSSTSANPLNVIIACKILNCTYKWITRDWDDTRWLIPGETDFDNRHALTYIEDNLWPSGTHGSYVNLIENKTDLILVAREPSDDELELARNRSVEMEIKPIALDAFVFILNNKNPVDDLALKDIQGIYTGNITNWKQVGGKEAEINAYTRNDNSGSHELMKDLVMKDLKMIEAEEMILYGMAGPFNKLNEDEDGISYSVYYYEEFMSPNENVKLCGVDNVMPSYNNIKSGKYRFTTEVYAAIRTDQDPNSTAYQLWDWLLTEEGQKVVKESGYVPIDL